MGTTPCNLAADHLFTVIYEGETQYLPEDQVQTFHRKVSQLLFMGARYQQEINTAVAFLTTHVKKIDDEYPEKLKRAMKYIKGTSELKLTLRVGDTLVVKWWVDALYAMNEDCRGHTIATISLGKGEVSSFSIKQKINGKIST